MKTAPIIALVSSLALAACQTTSTSKDGTVTTSKPDAATIALAAAVAQSAIQAYAQQHGTQLPPTKGLAK